MTRIKALEFSRVPLQEGCKCDRCGQWIRNIWTARFSDGLVLHYGIECINNLIKKSGLDRHRNVLLQKAMKRREFYENMRDAYISGEMTAETDERYKEDQLNEQSGWYGEPYEDFKNWMLNRWIPYRFETIAEEIEKLNISFAR